MSQVSWKALMPGLLTEPARRSALIRLLRLDKPIGFFLLLWPTWWALWFAAGGLPSIANLIIFTLGVMVMRMAGCVVNDLADRRFDGQVERTRERPLATGQISPREAIVVFVVLALLALGLVLMTNRLTLLLSLVGLFLAVTYPFMKRYTWLPQVYLGAAFGWAVPMAWAAETGGIDSIAWLLLIATVLWATVYDTMYAMVDREDDIRLGIRSTAILFGDIDRLAIGITQLMMLWTLHLAGSRAGLGSAWLTGLAVAAGLMVYHQWLIRHRDREGCFEAFLHNNWIGVAVFAGLLIDTLMSS